MNIFFRMIQNERIHFHRINSQARRLVISSFLYSIAFPILMTFSNIYLWRQSGNFYIVGAYNIGTWFILPFIFYLNGYLLKRFSISLLYLSGALLSGLITFALIFFFMPNIFFVFIFGVLFGIGHGLYWSNRNFLTLKSTESINRNYFSSLWLSLHTIANIAVPFFTGWFIVLGTKLHIYTPIQSYRILGILAIIILFLSGCIVFFTNYSIPHINYHRLEKITQRWVIIRLAILIIGILNGVTYFLPPLMIFLLLGNEGSIGTIQSFAAIVSAIIVYHIGKRSLIHHRTLILSIGVSFIVMGAIFFAITYSGFGAVVYTVFSALATLFIWSAFSPILMDLIDLDSKGTHEKNYAYIFDQELFLNTGRIIGGGIFLVFYFLLARDLTIRYSPLAIALTQIAVIFLVKKLHVREKKE